MTNDPAARLKAGLDADETVAKAAAAAVHMDGCAAGDWSWMDSVGAPQKGDYPVIYHEMRQDPARVLREVAAKREILASYEERPTWALRPIIEHLAAVYGSSGSVAWMRSCNRLQWQRFDPFEDGGQQRPPRSLGRP